MTSYNLLEVYLILLPCSHLTIYFFAFVKVINGFPFYSVHSTSFLFFPIVMLFLVSAVESSDNNFVLLNILVALLSGFHCIYLNSAISFWWCWPSPHFSTCLFCCNHFFHNSFYLFASLFVYFLTVYYIIIIFCSHYSAFFFQTSCIFHFPLLISLF